MSEDLSLALQKLFPSADPTLDFVLVDDGKGPHIEKWDTVKLDAQPTAAQITQAKADVSAARAAAKTAEDAERANGRTLLAALEVGPLTAAQLRQFLRHMAYRVRRLERLASQAFD